jgi:hypothetical protein
VNETTGITKMPVGGSAPTVLAPATPAWIITDGTSVYWGEGSPTTGSISKVPTAGGAVTTVVSGAIWPQYLAVDAVNVYWNETMAGTINSVPIAGGIIGTLASNQMLVSPLSSIAVAKGSLYWPQDSLGAMELVPTGGGTVKTFSDMDGPQYLVTDSYNVYWAEHQGGISSMPLGGGAVQRLVAASTNSVMTGAAVCLAVDQTDIYWGDGSDAIVQKAPKAP